MDKIWESISKLNNRFLDLYEELATIREQIQALTVCLQEIKVVCEEGSETAPTYKNNLSSFN